MPGRDLFAEDQPKGRDLFADTTATTEAPAWGMDRPLSRNPLQWVRGLGEAGLSVGTGMVSAPLNSFWNAAMNATDNPEGQPVGTYMPKTAEGQTFLSILDKTARMTGLPQAIERGTDVNNPDPAVRATGNLMQGALGVFPGIGALKRMGVARKLSTPAAAPSIEAIRDASQAAFKNAEKSGELLKQSSFESFIPKVESMLADEGVDPDLHPKTMVALRRVYEDATKPGVYGMSPKGTEITRRVLSNAENEAIAASQPGKVSSDARLAGKLLDEYDSFIEDNMPSTTAAGKEARALWSQKLRADEIANVFERAKNQAGQYSVSGMDNALRVQFKQLADNPRRFRRFSDEEQAAILKTVRTGNLQFVLQTAGKFSPVRGGMPSIATYLTTAANPMAGVLMAAGAEGSKFGSYLMRKANANAVDQLVRRGRDAPGTPGFFQSLPRSGPLEQLGYIPAGALGYEETKKGR